MGKQLDTNDPPQINKNQGFLYSIVNLLKFKKTSPVNLDMASGKIPLNLIMEAICAPQDLYKDAVIFKNHADNTNEKEGKERYLRVSLICYCAATEAEINVAFWSFLKSKTNLNSYETKLLTSLENNNPDNYPPKLVKMIGGKTINCTYLPIRHRLYIYIPYFFNSGSIIDWTTNKIDAFEEYIKLNGVRNSILHYAKKNRNQVYDLHFGHVLNYYDYPLSHAVNDASQIINNLFIELNNLTLGKIVKQSWIE